MKTFIALVKREHWEHPAIWIVPAVFATLMILGHLYGVYGLWRYDVDFNELRWGIEQVTSMAGADRHGFLQAMLLGLSVPFSVFLVFLVFFYSLDSLYADRRDRSILFWKSMPVSDVETVMSKVAMATIGAPAITLAVLMVFHVVSALFGTGIALWAGAEGWYHALNPWVWITTWAKIGWALFSLSSLMLPIIAWVMMASAWARKAPFLWATVPPVAVLTFEFINFDRSRLVEWVADHFVKGIEKAMLIHGERVGIVRVDGKDHFESGIMFEVKFDILWSYELWSGVAIAAVFIAGAIWLRRYRADAE